MELARLGNLIEQFYQETGIASRKIAKGEFLIPCPVETSAGIHKEIVKVEVMPYQSGDWKCFVNCFIGEINDQTDTRQILHLSNYCALSHTYLERCETAENLFVGSIIHQYHLNYELFAAVIEEVARFSLTLRSNYFLK